MNDHAATESTPSNGANADSSKRPLRVANMLPSGEARRRLRRWRSVKDTVSKLGVGYGGISVIIALALIFLYLVFEVFPLFRSASVSPTVQYAAPGNTQAQTLAVAMNRFRDLGTRFADDGTVTFFDIATGAVEGGVELALPEEVSITAVGRAEPRTRLVALGLSDGTAMVVRHAYDTTYGANTERFVDGFVEYPLAEEPLVVSEQGEGIRKIAVQEGSQGITVVAWTEADRLLLVRFTTRTSFMTGEVEIEPQAYELPAPPRDSVSRLMLSIDQRNLFVGDEDGFLHYYDVARPENARLVESRRVVDDGNSVTALEFLLGTVSVIVGGEDGSVSQWFLVRDEHNVFSLTRVRGFESHSAPVNLIVPEYSRKGFATADTNGTVAVHFSTSERTLIRERVANGPIRVLSFAPRANGLVVVDESEAMRVLDVSNPHPQVSVSSLWGKVWYEGRSGSDFVWQSSSATDEFESKFSLVPLTLGTIKAAFYAMLFAIPLAVMGAIYTAYFMSPRMRGLTKPTIEIMEALPTVILGFLAGLWLAPFVENNLPAVFGVLILMPIGMVVMAFVWHSIPRNFRLAIPDGWEAALLIPVILFIGWACVTMSPFVEIALFNGDMRQWLTDTGINYDQRNALVVGIAMGFAVIPTIFSIAEDAVFNVPKHLTQGSLALGATPWQTVLGVVLLTASPGIFSAIMIGFGRAVGETMIVLMATGNSPIMNFNIFEGMRTLSANIAVEMPESEFGGTHYRILFLAALVLFVMTFAVNTVAEIVRQRLRRKYASL